MTDVTIDVDFATAYGADEHVLVRNEDFWGLLHPEGCPVSMVTAWADGRLVSTPIYECPAGVECWQGDGPPDDTVTPGLWSVKMHLTEEGLEWDESIPLVPRERTERPSDGLDEG